MARAKKVALNIDASTAWAAAVAAQRINGGYMKFIEPSKNDETNRQIMERLIAAPDQLTDEDKELGEEVRSYFKGLMFQIISGKKLNDFLNTALTIANRDIIEDKFDIAVIASLPQSYEKAKGMDNAMNKIRFASGGYAGAVGEKITCNVEILKVIFSQRWNSFVVNAINDQEQVLFFFTGKGQFTAGQTMKIQGKVKAHRDNQTQLNYVKVV